MNKSLCYLFVFLMLPAWFSKCKAQKLSHYSIQSGFNYYWFHSKDNFIYGGARANGKLGGGVSFILDSASTVRFEYNAHYIQEKYCLNYLEGFYDYGEKRHYLNHVLQHQFLFALTGKRNIFQFRFGLDWDIVLNRQSLESGKENKCINTDENDTFKYQSLNSHFGLAFNLLQKVSLSFDVITGFTPWYIVGVHDNYQDFSNVEVKKRMVSIGVSYFIYPRGKNR